MTERGLHRRREAVLSGGAGHGTGPRTEIAASWRRVAASGLDPGRGADIAPLALADLERRREASGLVAMVPRLAAELASVVEADQMVVVADPEGRVLWRLGHSRIKRLADGLGFVGGSAWTEVNVGTNAIGTALVLGEAVQVQGPEHFVDSHTRWGCAAAPLTDPWTGRTLGVVDVSGPSREMHPAELALVSLAARTVSAELLAEHRAALDRLRARAAPMLARLTGDVLAVDAAGHVAASIGRCAPESVVLPDALRPGRVRLPVLGGAVAEPIGGGWLLRIEGGRDAVDEAATALVLDLDGEPCLRVSGTGGDWSLALTPRHAEILMSLIDAGPDGRTAAQLALDLFGDAAPAVTVRAEVSRLRRVVGGIILSGPYRLDPRVRARVRCADPATVLPRSSAPVVRRLRPVTHG